MKEKKISHRNRIWFLVAVIAAGICIIALSLSVLGAVVPKPTPEPTPEKLSTILYPYRETVVEAPNGDLYRTWFFTAGEREDIYLIVIFFISSDSENEYFYAEVPRESTDYPINWKSLSIQREGEHLWLIYPPDFELVQED